ncbi:unnamed protein product [Cylindrotheca closterium]|uniref:MYND-type domain-containing protein n=1 Tax=Cylindrotheca closterium TaxID=2856 RepID=A0AAD2FTN0_9STRA|nr:unnamed protein product [Cylindrotheca closterium]
MSKTKDYYEGKDNLWHDGWFEMFRNGQWMSDSNFSNTMVANWDSYHPYSCNGCKRGGLQSLNLVRCSGCKVVKYCCRDHQKKDWSTHKKWCKAFNKVSDINDEIDEKIDWTEWNRRQNERNIKLMSIWVGDLSHTPPIQIALVQPHCRQCYRSGRISGVDLVVCPSCNGVAICKSCLGNEDVTWETFHNGDQQECELYLIYLCCSGMVVEKGQPLLAASDTNCKDTFNPKDWIEYFEKKGNDFDMGVGLPISALRFMAPITCFLTNGLTLAMTTQMLLGKLNLLKKSELRIHILGGASHEISVTRAFIELGRLNPQLKRLDIVVVGPSLRNYSYSYSHFLFPSEVPCHLDGTVDHVKDLYHNSSVASGPVPDLFMAFNPGFHDPSHFVNWRSTVELVRTRTGVPLCITGLNFSEVQNDVRILKDMGFQEKMPPTANPFRSMRPFLDPSREETDFIYNNKAYAIVQGIP